MWIWSDLKSRLTLRLAVLSAACFAAASAYGLVDADRSARTRIETAATIAAGELTLQQSKLDWVKGQPVDFPDLDPVAVPLMAPGLCLAYRAGSDLLQRVCSGPDSAIAAAPVPFAALYRALFDPGRETARPVRSRDGIVGEAVVWVDPDVATAAAWRETSRPAAMMAVTLVLLCGLAHAALARALRPTRLIRAGLERIAANDLSARLPPFDLAELSPIRDVFNQLAEGLEAALAERTELMRRLIALQDDERRHLARELHDEFGQNLTAIRALAAAAGQTAAQDCPALHPECEAIARTAAGMMEILRGALFRLRPPDVEELGLAASLEGLVAGWNGRSRNGPRFEIGLRGRFESVPAEAAAGLYRIAQEALTNAAKHAGATRVTLSLVRGDSGEIELAVADDGRPAERPGVAELGGAGLGLLGMRERAATLGGNLRFATEAEAGSVLSVVVPATAGRAA